MLERSPSNSSHTNAYKGEIIFTNYCYNLLHI